MNSQVLGLLPVILPLAAIQLGFQIYCLVDIWKLSEGKRDKQDRLVWTLVVLLFGLFGPIFYIVFERK